MPSLPAVFVELRATTSSFQASFDQAKKTVNDFSSQSTSGLQKLEQVGKVAFLGIAGAATAFGAIAVKAALEGEQAHAQLVNAVTNSGTAFASVGGKVDDMSARFAKLGFENDQVEAAMARMVTASGSTQVAMTNMALAADLARARHISLEEASGALGKVLAGNMRGMQAFGLSTKDASGSVLSTAAAVAELNQRFGGAAGASADTYAGKLQALNAEWHNMTEVVGNMLLPVLADIAGVAADAVGWFDKHREVAAALAGVVGGPLVAAMTIYAAKQAIAFGANVAGAIGNVARAIFGIVPAAEAAEAAETGLATTTALATGGLSILGAGVGLLAAKWLGHSSATKEASSSAEGAAGAVGDLSGAEGDLGGETDAATASLKAQSDMFKKLNGDANEQQSEILTLIGDQNSLDAATDKLRDSSAANSEVTKQAAQHTKDLAEANKAVTSAAADVADALDRQATSKKKLDDLMKPQTQQNVSDATDKFQASQDRVTRANIAVTEKTTDLNTAINQYGEGSQQATLAQLDLNDALRDQRSAVEESDTALQGLADANRATIGTTDDVKVATKDYGDATDAVTDAQAKQKDAQSKLNDVLANSGAIKAAKDDTKNLADNTLAWQRATLDFNADWGKLEGIIGAHPELRDQLVGQVTAVRNNLPKGADVKPFNDFLDKINGLDMNKLNATAVAGLSLAGWESHEANRGVPTGRTPTLEEILTGGAGIIGGGAAEGAVIQARPGGTLMLTGEGGQDEAILPLPDDWRSGGFGTAGGGGVSIGSVMIVVGAGNYDEDTLANKVRDKLIMIGRNNVNVGLS